MVLFSSTHIEGTGSGAIFSVNYLKKKIRS